MKLRILRAALVASCLLALAPVSAMAYNYTFIPEQEHAHVMGLDAANTTTIQILHNGSQTLLEDFYDGDTEINFNDVEVGDVVKVFQPETSSPDSTSPVAVFTMPNFTTSGSAGSPTISGAAPDGWTVTAVRYPACDGVPTFANAVAGGGAFSMTFPTPSTPGTSFRLMATSSDGNAIGLHGSPFTLTNSDLDLRIGGDANCVDVDASGDNSEIDVSGLDTDAEPSTRLVLRRGGAVLADQNYRWLSLPSPEKPQAGDVLDVYRPSGAATPSFSWTVPAVSGKFDVGNGLTAVDAPAAFALRVNACVPAQCDTYETRRAAVDTPAGRTIFDFSKPLGGERAMSLAGVQMTGEWIQADGNAAYYFNLAQGDLTSPVGKVSLAKTLKKKTLGKKALKIKLSSSEAGSAVATLTIPGKSKKSRPVKLASGKKSIKVGSNTLSLKFSKSGKKALKKIARKKKTSAKLTITLTDAAGNSTTVVKGTTIK